MGRNRRRQATHAQFRFLKMLRPGIYAYFQRSLSRWAHVTWQYSIVLYPRNSPEQTKSRPLVEEEILVTLRNAPGVVPRSLAPPGVTPAPIDSQRSVPSRFFPVDHGHVLI